MVNDEIDALVTSLDAQREHVLGALEGLSDDQLRRPALPSGWTPLGLVQHLALALRRTILHVIAETATHAGHLDAARELMDGEQWIVLTR